MGVVDRVGLDAQRMEPLAVGSFKRPLELIEGALLGEQLDQGVQPADSTTSTPAIRRTAIDSSRASAKSGSV